MLAISAVFTRVIRVGAIGRVVALCVALTLALAEAAVGSGKIHLQIDTGGHTAQISSIAFTPDGRDLVSASRDKLVRIWELSSGFTRRAIRGEIGLGAEGELAAMALSPDGRWLAVGGWLDEAGALAPCCGDIRVHDYATGRVSFVMHGHREPVRSLAFSPDGKHLVSGSTDGAVILWDMSIRAPIRTLLKHGGEVHSVAFTTDGQRFISTSADRDTRMSTVADGLEVARMQGHSEKVLALAVAPQGDILATGDSSGEIRLWDARDGRFLRMLAHEQSQITSMVFLRSGDGLVVTLGYSPYAVHVRDLATGDIARVYRGHDNFVSASAVSPDGALVATAGGERNEIHVWNAQSGELVRTLKGKGSVIWSVGFGRQGPSLAWGKTDPCPTERLSCPRLHGTLQTEIRLPAGNGQVGELGDVKDDGHAFVRAVETRGDGWSLEHRVERGGGYESLLEVRKADAPVAVIRRDAQSGFRHRAYTFTPDGQAVISAGANGYLASYRTDGKPMSRFVGHEGDILAVSVSGDGRLLASGSSDQTVRLWNANTGRLVVTLFSSGDGNWVMWTPQGYYTGSPGADEFVGWQINRGSDKTPDYVSAAQLRTKLNRPDIVGRAIELASAEEAIREATPVRFDLAELESRPPPIFDVKEIAQAAQDAPGRGSIEVTVGNTADPVKFLYVFVRGVQVAVVRAKRPAPDQAARATISIPLAEGENDVRVTAVSAAGDTSKTMTVTRNEPGKLDSRGTLRILAVGVDKYPSAGKALTELSYAGADAKAFLESFRKRLGPLHTKTVLHLLTNDPANEAPTASRIRQALDELREAEDNDTVVVFLAGHGVNDGPNYRFLPTDAEKAGKGWSSDKSISWNALEEALQSANGKRLMFVDTCRSGGAYNQRLGNAAYHINVVVYSSSRWDESAIERNDISHGLFTYALVEGLEGKAKLANDTRITTTRLHNYIANRVVGLAKEIGETQNPQIYYGRDATDFTLAEDHAPVGATPP